MLANRLGACLAAALTVALGPTVALADGVLFVDGDAPPAGDGTTWGTAYRFLQDALADAAGSGGAICEIRVAQGTYRPDRDEVNPEGTGAREATFTLVDGLAVSGGFAGAGEPDPDLRDVALYETILGGDLDGDDGPDFANNEENSHHVVTGTGTSAATEFDGFTISGGNTAPLGPPDYVGGGLVLGLESDTTVRNCTFTANFATRGGGLYTRGTSTSAVVLGCTFVGNAADLGGGMFNDRSRPWVIDCEFTGNHAAGAGAGGGGMHNFDSSLPTIVSTLFVGNTAIATGGAMRNLINADPLLINCTLVANDAGEAGGGLHSNSGSDPTIVNSIFWANTDKSGNGSFAQIGGGTTEPVVSFSCVQGGFEGVNNIDADPMFEDEFGPDALPGTGDEDLRLSDLSPCIDAGDNSVVDECRVDLDRNTRRVDDPGTDDTGAGDPPIVDMGAYEFLGTFADCNDNFVLDACDPDCNCNGIPDECEIAEDPMLDADGSGILDECEEAGDLDGDGDVGFSDLLMVLGTWGPCDECPEDIDDSGDVGFSDLLVVLAAWGPCD